MNEKYITMTANQLVSLVQQGYKFKIMLESVEVADLENQHHPKRYNIGYGGVCTLRFKVI